MRQHEYTPGPVKVHEGHDYIHVYDESRTEHLIASVYEIKDASLIAEAFNVTQETGLTPRQLADANRELIELLLYGEKMTNPFIKWFRSDIDNWRLKIAVILAKHKTAEPGKVGE